MRKAVVALLSFLPFRLLLRFGWWLARGADRLLSLAYGAAVVPLAWRRETRLHWTTEVKFPDRITWGNRVIVGPGCTLGALGEIRLGDDVRLSKGVVLETAGLDLSGRPPAGHVGSRIRIGDRVWIGAGALVLGGVEIGSDSIVGAGTVVSKDLPPGTILVGAAPRMRPRGLRSEAPGSARTDPGP